MRLATNHAGWVVQGLFKDGWDRISVVHATIEEAREDMRFLVWPLELRIAEYLCHTK